MNSHPATKQIQSSPGHWMPFTESICVTFDPAGPTHAAVVPASAAGKQLCDVVAQLKSAAQPDERVPG